MGQVFGDFTEVCEGHQDESCLKFHIYLREISFLLFGCWNSFQILNYGTGDTLIKSIRRRWTKRKRRLSKGPAKTKVGSVDDLKERLPDAMDWQLETIRAVQSNTMTSPERILALCESTRYLVRNQIDGDFVECGVWRGGSMAAVAYTLRHMGNEKRTLWLYDTYDGMSAPTTVDVDFLGRRASELMRAENSKSNRADSPDSIWCSSPLAGVQQTMEETGYPTTKINFVKGKVEETLTEHKPNKIALLRLDTDWYESTRCELEQLFPRLVPGSVLIIDDYGHWNGCRRAVDEYFEHHQIQMLLNRIDYTARIGIYWPQASNGRVPIPLSGRRPMEVTRNHVV